MKISLVRIEIKIRFRSSFRVNVRVGKFDWNIAIYIYTSKNAITANRYDEVFSTPTIFYLANITNDYFSDLNLDQVSITDGSKLMLSFHDLALKSHGTVSPSSNRWRPSRGRRQQQRKTGSQHLQSNPIHFLLPLKFLQLTIHVTDAFHESTHGDQKIYWTWEQ